MISGLHVMAAGYYIREWMFDGLFHCPQTVWQGVCKHLIFRQLAGVTKI